jgi:tRNA 2-thiocytidine biosynthesis protein TtcA
MFSALQNVVPSHLADGTIHDFRNLKASGMASDDGDKAFDEEEFPAPAALPNLQVIRM